MKAISWSGLPMIYNEEKTFVASRGQGFVQGIFILYSLQIIKGILPIGVAFKTIVDPKWDATKESTQNDFYISSRLLWEYTGIIYKKSKEIM